MSPLVRIGDIADFADYKKEPRWGVTFASYKKAEMASCSQDKALWTLYGISAGRVCGKDSWSHLEDWQQDYFYRLRPDLS